MPQYALLVNPGHNWVYFEESKKLSVSELNVVLAKMSTQCFDVMQETIADIFYITFSSETHLSAEDMALLSRLSFVYAIYECRTVEGQKLLLPLPKNSFQFMNTNLSSILKYKGKTNEIFTRMMLNLAVFSSDFSNCTDIRLLDPICGKGTTLFEGLIAGYNVYGIEIGPKVVNETWHYFKKYLETAKYKHEAKIEKINTANKSTNAVRYKCRLAKSKEDMKKYSRHFEIIAGNSFYANQYYKKNSFHLIVGDLPYGVQHGNVTNERQSSLTRNPNELLKSCLPVWRDLLIPGGSVALSWNTFVLPRDEMKRTLENAGLFVLNEGKWLEFEHRVDQSIKRDIIVAKK